MTEQIFTAIVFPAFIGLQSFFSGLFIRVGVAFLARWQQFRAHGVTATATIVDVEASTLEGGGTTWFPILDFTTDAGEIIRTRSADSTGLEPSVGDSLEILYLRGQPQTVTAKGKLVSWFGFGVTAWVVPGIYIFAFIARLPLELIAVSMVSHVVGFGLSARMWRQRRR